MTEKNKRTILVIDICGTSESKSLWDESDYLHSFGFVNNVGNSFNEKHTNLGDPNESVLKGVRKFANWLLKGREGQISEFADRITLDIDKP